MSMIPEIRPNGERLTTDCLGPIVSEHLHRYALAGLYVHDKDVLDIACGEGYGSNYLSTNARTVTGVDISSETIAHAKAKYQRSNLRFSVGACTAIPLSDHSIDVIVSFETLEHILEHDIFFCEIKRVLRKGGILLISTPDKKNYSEKPKSNNIYHVKELYSTQFQSLVKGYFRNAYYGNQVYLSGSVLEFCPPTEILSIEGDYRDITYQKFKNAGVYCLAIASDADIQNPESSLFRFTTNTPIRPSQYARCEVFVSSDSNYSADKSEACSVHFEEKAVLQFERLKLHSAKGEVFLRIDPLDRLGAFEIEKTSVCFGNRNDTNESISPRVLPLSIIAATGCAKIAVSKDCYVALEDDPQIFLAPFEWDGVTDWWLEVEMYVSEDLRAIEVRDQQRLAHIRDLELAVGHRERIVENCESELALSRQRNLTAAAQIKELQFGSQRLTGELQAAQQSLAESQANRRLECERLTAALRRTDNLRQQVELDNMQLQRQWADDKALHLVRLARDKSHYEALLQGLREEFFVAENGHKKAADLHRIEMLKICSSFSWKITQPLRRVETWFKKFKSWAFGMQSTVMRSRRSVLELIHYNLERPADKPYQCSDNPVVVEGWCVGKAGEAIQQVRVRLGRRIIICSHIDRPDVVSHFIGSFSAPQATGFRAEFKTGVGLKRLRIEACTQSGQWLLLGTRLLRVTAYVAPESILSLPGDDETWSKEPDVALAAVPDIKAIAFYLPQFHSIPENDLWWGEGFTEWSNVKPAQPQFVGHYQPHVPTQELGYYDLREIDVMHKQAAIARAAGIHGFCFYYYWFGGKRLLEKPLELMLNCRALEMPFCYCWANENWSRRWDGRDAEILIAQNHSFEDDVAIIHDIARALRDRRYIRVNGRPLLIVYRPALLPNACATFERWRTVCRELGIGEIHLAGVKGFGCGEPSAFGLDALIEFPPNDSGVTPRTRELVKSPEQFEGKAYDIREVRAHCGKLGPQGFTFYRGVTPSWDNTARRKKHASVFLNSSPSVYYNWLQQAIDFTRKYLPTGQKFLFINAWNEWAEGCHLEPDRRYGYAWLNATRKALGSYSDWHASMLSIEQTSLEENGHHEAQVLIEPTQDKTSQNAAPRMTIQAPELAESPTIVISALFYYREDLIYDFLEKIIPQACDLLQKHNCLCKIVLLLNYPALPKTQEQINVIVSRSMAHQRLKVITKAPGYNSGFGLGHNRTFEENDSDLFILINSDLRVEKHDWLSDILTCANSEPRPAIIGPISSAARLRGDGCGVDVMNPIDEGFDFVDGSLLAINSAVARRLGLFNESIRFFYFEDSDLCLRYMQAGYRIALVDIRTQHARSVSAQLLPRALIRGVLDHNRGRFFDLWGSFLENRKLSNRLALIFSSQDLALQIAAWPAIMGLLADHPTAILDIGGVVPFLHMFFKHGRIELKPSRQISEQKGIYHRHYAITYPSSNGSLVADIACQIGVEPRVADAAMHIRSLSKESISRQVDKIVVCVSPPDQLRMGLRPRIGAWNKFVRLLGEQYGGSVIVHSDIPTYDMTPYENLTEASLGKLLQDFSDAKCVVTGDHWTLQLAQILGVKTLAWLGCTPSRTLVWAWENTGVFSDKMLDCLGCSLHMGAKGGSICLRGDERCMAADHVPAFLEMAIDFISQPTINPPWHISAWTPAVLSGGRRSEQLDLGRWRESVISEVLIIVLGYASDTARSAATCVAASIPGSRVIFVDRLPDSATPSTLVDIVASNLVSEKWVFCVSGSIENYQIGLLEELVIHAGVGIAAPFVVIAPSQGTLDAVMARAVCDQFMDTHSCETIHDLSVADLCYIGSADIFRHLQSLPDYVSIGKELFLDNRISSNVLTCVGVLEPASHAAQSAFCRVVQSSNFSLKLVTSQLVVATTANA